MEEVENQDGCIFTVTDGSADSCQDEMDLSLRSPLRHQEWSWSSSFFQLRPEKLKKNRRDEEKEEKKKSLGGKERCNKRCPRKKKDLESQEEGNYNYPVSQFGDKHLISNSPSSLSMSCLSKTRRCVIDHRVYEWPNRVQFSPNPRHRSINSCSATLHLHPGPLRCNPRKLPH